MYVLVNKDRVVLGPRTWNKSIFEYTLKDDYGVFVTLPSTKQDSIKIQINDDLKICLVEHIKPVLNEKVQHYGPPVFNTAGDIVYAQYDVLFKPVDMIKQELKAKVAQARWEKETGGVDVGAGNIVLTDAVSQSKVSGAVAMVSLNPTAVINWKGANGWMQLNAQQIQGIALAVGAHVQACFTKEKQLNDAIDACTTAMELNDLDLTF